MQRSVVIVGANQTGLFLSELLGKSGFSVSVYEKKDAQSVAYDWHDDLLPGTFEKVGLPLPPRDTYFKKGNWSFVSPDETTIVKIAQDEDKTDISLSRRGLNAWLYERAQGCAQFHYGCGVRAAEVEEGRVVGVRLEDDSVVHADLVVDCAGVDSALRASLPPSFGIAAAPNAGDVFVAYRGFFRRDPTQPAPFHHNKVYLKHLGQAGISWCIDEPQTGSVNVLVGRIDRLEPAVLEQALDALVQGNPILTRELVRGGQICRIPVRRPLSKTFANGYVALGDSAFMTIPMLGSGMACGLVGAKLLADVLANPEQDVPFSEAHLYRYHLGMLEAFGADYRGVEVMKNWLLATPAEDVSWLFGSGILGETELKAAGIGDDVPLSASLVGRVLKKGLGHLPLLLRLVGTMQRMKKKSAQARTLPPAYDPAAFTAWQKEYDSER